jgi:hypothetical protein
MELLSNAPAHATVPDRYVFPPEKCAALQLGGHSLHDDDGVTLPIVDLHYAALAGDDGLRWRVARRDRPGRQGIWFLPGTLHT